MNELNSLGGQLYIRYFQQFIVITTVSSSSFWNSYPQEQEIFEYLDTGEKDNDQPVYWEQYYSDILDDDANDEKSNIHSRQLEENNRDKRMRQVNNYKLSLKYNQ